MALKDLGFKALGQNRMCFTWASTWSLKDKTKVSRHSCLKSFGIGGCVLPYAALASQNRMANSNVLQWSWRETPRPQDSQRNRPSALTSVIGLFGSANLLSTMSLLEDAQGLGFRVESLGMRVEG